MARITREAQILEALSAAGEPMTSAEIADLVGVSRERTTKILQLLKTEGRAQLIRAGGAGAWRLSEATEAII